MNVLNKWVYLFSIIFLLRNKSILPSNYFILEAHAYVIIGIILDTDLYFVNTSVSFFSDNYQITDAFDNLMCTLIWKIDYVQRNEPMASGYGPGWLFQY